MSTVRVRIAPSPTGPIHVGTVHTALFNWLFARHEGGRFILRLEDTDVERSREEWVHHILQELRWVGLDWDEGPDVGGPHGPYRQMERLDLYQEAARKLLASGHAYHCYCNAEELEAERKAAQAQNVVYQYSRRCRRLSAAERSRFEAEGRRPCVRFAVPDGTTVAFDDIIRGRIEFPSDSIGDFVIMRPNGIPLYNFAVVIDDAGMAISHVLRGEEHISNTPVQVLLFEALGLPQPRFGHFGIMLNADRSKMSKRRGDAFVGWYRDNGYLPEALLNFMALLGWTPDGGREFVTREEMIREFSLDRVTKSAAVFDIAKLDWMNGHYIRQTDIRRLTDLCLPFLRHAGLVDGELSPAERDRVERIVALEQERIKTLSELAPATAFFFREPIEYDASAVARVLTPEARGIVGRVADLLEDLADWAAPSLERATRAFVDRAGLNTKAVFQPIRVAVTGGTVSPPLFDTLALVGRERALQRMRRVANGEIGAA